MSRIGRRALLKAGVCAGLGLSVTPKPAIGQDDPASVRPREAICWSRPAIRLKKPLTPNDIRLGAPPIIAWAMDPKTRTVRSGSRLNQVLLVRLDAKKLSPDTASRAVRRRCRVHRHLYRILAAKWTIGSATSKSCIAPVMARSSIPRTAQRSLKGKRRGHCRHSHSSSIAGDS